MRCCIVLVWCFVVCLIVFVVFAFCVVCVVLVCLFVMVVVVVVFFFWGGGRGDESAVSLLLFVDTALAEMSNKVAVFCCFVTEGGARKLLMIFLGCCSLVVSVVRPSISFNCWVLPDIISFQPYGRPLSCCI